jgi:hypothetical protein
MRIVLTVALESGRETIGRAIAKESGPSARLGQHIRKG